MGGYFFILRRRRVARGDEDVSVDIDVFLDFL